MVNASTEESKPTFSTMGTVSAPIELEAKGEHTAVQVDGGKGKRKISPKVKVTLTSLTPNNVSCSGVLTEPRLLVQVSFCSRLCRWARFDGLIRWCCLSCTRTSSIRTSWIPRSTTSTS